MAHTFYLLQVLPLCHSICTVFQKDDFISTHSLDMFMQEHANISPFLKVFQCLSKVSGVVPHTLCAHWRWAREQLKWVRLNHVPAFSWLAASRHSTGERLSLACLTQVNSEFLLCCGTTLANKLGTAKASQSRSFQMSFGSYQLMLPAW